MIGMPRPRSGHLFSLEVCRYQSGDRHTARALRTRAAFYREVTATRLEDFSRTLVSGADARKVYAHRCHGCSEEEGLFSDRDFTLLGDLDCELFRIR